jgi:hypothetical protein
MKTGEMGKLSPENPPNPPLLKGGRGDFWKAFPAGKIISLVAFCDAVSSVVSFFSIS